MAKSYRPENVFHYGMSVDDMDAAVTAWAGIGAKVLMPPAEAIGVDVLCCVILYNDTVLELVAPSNEEGRKRMAPRTLRPGVIDHVAYFTDDIAADLASFEKDGGVVQVPVVFNTAFDRNMAFILMPTGFVIELMDRNSADNLPADPLATYFKAIAA